jgi:lipopolysaccharide transport system permease protein
MKINKKNNEWDLVIEPKTSIFRINFAEIWRYRDLLGLLVRRDFISFYKQTILGPLWFFIQPLFTTIIYVLIFGNLASLSTDGLPKPLFYMVGIIAWNYFAECLNKTSTVFKENANIFGKVYFPRLIMPLSIIASNLIKLAVQFFMLILLITYLHFYHDYEIIFTVYLLMIPVLVLIMASLGLGLGMIISALTTKYRDLTFLITFGVQLFMYATPVVYPISAAPEKYKRFIELNPMSSIIEGLRFSILGKGEFSFLSLFHSLIITLIILLIGTLIFNRVEKNFVDTI